MLCARSSLHCHSAAAAPGYFPEAQLRTRPRNLKRLEVRLNPQKAQTLNPEPPQKTA